MVFGRYVPRSDVLFCGKEEPGVIQLSGTPPGVQIGRNVRVAGGIAETQPPLISFNPSGYPVTDEVHEALGIVG